MEEKGEMLTKIKLTHRVQINFELGDEDWNILTPYMIDVSVDELKFVYKRLCEMYTPESYESLEKHHTYTWFEFEWGLLSETTDFNDEFPVNIHQLKGDITHLILEFQLEHNKPKLYPHIQKVHDIKPDNALRILGYRGDESSSDNIL